MNCFECGFRCVTIYHTEERISHDLVCLKNPLGIWEKVVAVSSKCNMCGWESFRTKVPEPLS